MFAVTLGMYVTALIVLGTIVGAISAFTMFRDKETAADIIAGAEMLSRYGATDDELVAYFRKAY